MNEKKSRIMDFALSLGNDRDLVQSFLDFLTHYQEQGIIDFFQKNTEECCRRGYSFRELNPGISFCIVAAGSAIIIECKCSLGHAYGMIEEVFFTYPIEPSFFYTKEKNERAISLRKQYESLTKKDDVFEVFSEPSHHGEGSDNNEEEN